MCSVCESGRLRVQGRAARTGTHDWGADAGGALGSTGHGDVGREALAREAVIDERVGAGAHVEPLAGERVAALGLVAAGAAVAVLAVLHHAVAARAVAQTVGRAVVAARLWESRSAEARGRP